MKTKIKFVIMLLLPVFNLLSQVPLSRSLGNLNKVETVDQEFIFTTDFGKARIIIYSPNIVRIRAVKIDFVKDFSYAVIVNPVKCNIRISESPENYAIETDSIYIKVQKIPLRFAFYTKNNQLINTDDPAFGVSWQGDEVTAFKTLQPDERFLGLGEHTGNLDRRGEHFVNFNTDNPNYNESSKSLYATIPFYLGLHSGLSYGIFFDNSSRSVFSFGAGNNRFASFKADCGEMDYYFIYHTNIRKIIESYTWLTGRMPMPPIWSLGYQQCRYSYFPDEEVISTAKKFRERHIPADMIYLDIHYMDKYKLFTWDKERFPDPAETISQLKDLSFHTALIIDPGVKVEDEYNVYLDGLKSDIFVKYPDKTNYQGMVWPGWCNFPDFTMPKAREWWGKWMKTNVDVGVTGFWNDMNEIATWGQDVPDLIEFDWEGKKTTYREAKNVYGFLMARSSYEGTRKNMDGKRPFVLTRAGYSGLQRYTAIWTGDNQAYDDHMFLGVRLLNSMGLSGISFAGMDIGGFGGNPTQNLYIRWMQIGAFTPMFRGHTAINTNRTEPWAFGERTEDIVRRYIGFRYQLMPYIYSAFYESSQNGLPVMRSLAIDYSGDPLIYNYEYQQQYLFGPSILVALVKSNDRIAKVYLPSGTWYNLYTDEIFSGNKPIFIDAPLNILPVFIKEGSIIPMQKLVESTGEVSSDTLFMHVYAGTFTSNYTYYEDDGKTYDYLNGAYYKRLVRYDIKNNMIEFSQKEGGMNSKYSVMTLILHGFNTGIYNKVEINGKTYSLKSDKIRMFVSNFKFADYGPEDTKQINKVSFLNSDGIIKVLLR